MMSCYKLKYDYFCVCERESERSLCFSVQRDCQNQQPDMSSGTGSHRQDVDNILQKSTSLPNSLSLSLPLPLSTSACPRQKKSHHWKTQVGKQKQRRANAYNRWLYQVLMFFRSQKQLSSYFPFCWIIPCHPFLIPLSRGRQRSLLVGKC